MHTPEDRNNRRDRGRRGVALIIVLGFLSVMVLMAVAFLTQARVERMVAASSLEGMRTRQMAQTALAAAMQDYLNALKSISPAETQHDIFLSGDIPVTLKNYYSDETIGNDRLLIGKVEDWLTEGHLQDGKGANDPGDAVRNATWVWVRQQPGERSRILGRYAYACFDMSGLIDANLLGTAYGDNVPKYGDSTNRNNVRKMVLEALQEETGGEIQRKLNIHQRNWIGFDTPAALLNLTDGKLNTGGVVGGWAGTDMLEGKAINVDGLSPYSYAALHLGQGPSEKILGDAASLNSKGGSQFDAILAGADRAEVIQALKDYENGASLEPDGVNYPSAKNVPMFNEIGVQVKLVETPAGLGTNGLPASTYTLDLHMRIEFWYPFPSKDNEVNNLFTMALPSVGGSKLATGAADIWVQMAGSSGGLIELQTGPATTVPAAALQVPAKFNGNSPYYANNVGANNDVVFSLPLQRNNADPLLPPGMQLVVRNVQITKPLVLSLNKPVDSTPADKAIDFSFRDAPPVPPGASTAWQSVAVDDPRLNHRFGSWKAEDPPTFGEINQATKDAKSMAGDLTPGNYLYCRNGPMRSPAELGYLSSGTAWKTLDIFKDEGIWLMNRTVCDPDVFDAVKTRKVFFTNGTINPYTRNTNVLNAAFYGVDIREVPAMPGNLGDDDRFTGGNLKALVTEMMKEKTKPGYAGWSKILANKNLLGDFNKNQRIALVGDTWGLFNESDRLFVVVVIAQSIKEGEGTTGVGTWDEREDILTGERRAVALCWLDSSADGSADTLTQEMNIIMFQYLNE